jgi:hypothetical protein
LSQIKSPCSHGGNPNRNTQSLIATLAGLQIPFLSSETHELGEKIIASYLYQVHLYHWLEANNFGRFSYGVAAPGKVVQTDLIVVEDHPLRRIWRLLVHRRLF